MVLASDRTPGYTELSAVGITRIAAGRSEPCSPGLLSQGNQGRKLAQVQDMLGYHADHGLPGTTAWRLGLLSWRHSSNRHQRCSPQRMTAVRRVHRKLGLKELAHGPAGHLDMAGDQAWSTSILRLDDKAECLPLNDIL